MIKNLFTKRDHRSVAKLTKEQAMQASAWFWRSRQFGVNFTSPYSLHGEQYYSKLGLRQSIDVYATEEGKNAGVDLSFSAELTDAGGVAGLAGAVIWLPLTVAVGAVSFIQYENDAQRLMLDFWSYLESFPKNEKPPEGPAPIPSWAQTSPQAVGAAGGAQAIKDCPLCGAKIDSDSVFCKHCGTRL
jgi:hypothetical protein